MKLTKTLIILVSIFAIADIVGMKKMKMTPDGKSLLEAIQRRDRETVKQILKDRVDVNAQDNYYGHIALIRAVYQRNTEIVKHITFFVDNNTLQNYSQNAFDLLDQNMQNFITWFKNGTSLKDVSKENMQTYAQYALQFRGLDNDTWSSFLNKINYQDLDTTSWTEAMDWTVCFGNEDKMFTLLDYLHKKRQDSLTNTKNVQAIEKIIKNIGMSVQQCKKTNIQSFMQGKKILSKPGDVGFKFIK